MPSIYRLTGAVYFQAVRDALDDVSTELELIKQEAYEGELAKWNSTPRIVRWWKRMQKPTPHDVDAYSTELWREQMHLEILRKDLLGMKSKILNQFDHYWTLDALHFGYVRDYLKESDYQILDKR